MFVPFAMLGLPCALGEYDGIYTLQFCLLNRNVFVIPQTKGNILYCCTFSTNSPYKATATKCKLFFHNLPLWVTISKTCLLEAWLYYDWLIILHVSITYYWKSITTQFQSSYSGNSYFVKPSNQPVAHCLVASKQQIGHQV